MKGKICFVINGSLYHCCGEPSADRKEEMRTGKIEIVRREQTMLQKKKTLQGTLKGRLVYNKHEVKMEQKNHDKISVRLRVFFGCQQQLEIQCTLLAEPLAIKKECVMVKENLRLESRSNQARRDGEQQEEMLT